jgi:hypothetical protein
MRQPAVEHAALLASSRGEPFSDPPQSPAVAAAMGRVRATPPPEDELFALVTVTDRATGERRVLTRGTPAPEYARWIADPDAAPAGRIYWESEEATADADVEVVVRAVHLRAGRHRRTRLDKEEERALKHRNRGGGLGYRIDGDLRRRILAGEIDLASAAPVAVVVRLRRVPRLQLPKVRETVVDGLLYVGLTLQAERERAIIERKEALAALQARLLADIAALGGTVRYASWTGGSVTAVVPASAIRGLALHRSVLSLDVEGPSTLEGYKGDDSFVATDAEDFDANHGGDGPVPSGKHPLTSRILLGQSEDCIDEENPAFLDAAGEPARATFYDCDVPPCTEGGLEVCDFDTSGEQHGTKVAGIMMGDFMDGQDPQVLPPTDREMTGTCPECHLLFLQDAGSNDKEAVLDFVCEQGVDIFQSSIAQGTSCDGNGALDAEIEAMIDCDVIFVKGAANDGSTGGTCTTQYPADHPWTFAVAGIDTDAPCTTASAYYTADCDFADGSSMGGGDYNGVAGKASIIDIAAPWDHGAVITPDTLNPVVPTSGSGNSFANPFVAGLMADLLDWYATHVSDALFFDNRMRNFMLLMGDRSVDDAGTARALNFHDERWGAGRVGLVPWDAKNLWSIHRGSSFISSGGSFTHTLNISANATFLKVVVWHDGRDYQDEPMIGLELDPLDCATVSKSSNRRDSKHMLVYGTSTPLAGCTQVQMTIENILDGAAADRRFHYAAYTDVEDERHF